MFVIVDNGSAHRGRRSIDRLQGSRDNLRLIHTPDPRQLAQPGRDLLLRRATQVISPNDFADVDQLLNRVDQPTALGRLTRRIRRGHERMLEDRLAC